MAARPCVLTQSGTYGDEGKAASIATRWRLCYVCVGRNDARQFLTTGAGHSRTKSPQAINHPGSNDRANEGPDKFAEPRAVIQVTANEADRGTS
jgi:hypothetical protein